MTGLRESELAALNVQQYYNKGFHEVKRKGNKITKKIPLPNYFLCTSALIVTKRLFKYMYWRFLHQIIAQYYN